MSSTRLVHISDIHLPPLPESLGRLSFKQFLGYLSWQSKRRKHYEIDVLDALKKDVNDQAPHHYCITGDQTNLGTATEYQCSSSWLSKLADAEKVSVIPGNHDAYHKKFNYFMNLYWAPYMLDRSSQTVGVPYMRQINNIVLVGVSSAVLTAPFMADGRVLPRQAEQIEELLEELEHENVFRVMMIHHPPVKGIAPWRRALKRIERVTHCIEKYKIDLVLHGHLHKPMINTLEFDDRQVPVMGTAAAASNGKDMSPSQYFVIDIDEKNGQWNTRIKSRQYDPEAKAFKEVELPTNKIHKVK